MRVEEKVQDYLQAGVRLVWVIYPRTKTVVVYYPDGSAQRLTTADTLSGGEVLPGFALAVEAVFA